MKTWARAKTCASMWGPRGACVVMCEHVPFKMPLKAAAKKGSDFALAASNGLAPGTPGTPTHGPAWGLGAQQNQQLLANANITKWATSH